MIFVVLLSRHPPDFVIPTNAPISSSRRKPPTSSSRRKPGCSSLSLALGAFRETRLTSLCFTSRIPARRSLSLACPRESNQREGHPRYRGRRLQPATPRGRYGGSLTAHPCADSERARLLRAPLRAFPSASSPRHRGTPERRRARPSWPQKQPSVAALAHCSALSLDLKPV